jgi:hypothetical protein
MLSFSSRGCETPARQDRASYEYGSEQVTGARVRCRPAGLRPETEAVSAGLSKDTSNGCRNCTEATIFSLRRVSRYASRELALTGDSV